MQPQIAKRILKKKNEVEGLTLLDFKTYFTAMVVKADPHTPGNGTESPGRGAPLHRADAQQGHQDHSAE